MNRLAPGYLDAIDTALDYVPDRLLDRLRSVEFLCGVDPAFAGLHTFTDAADGRAYRDVPHCVYPWLQDGPLDQRRTTIVLPGPTHPWAITHELGHALHETLGFEPNASPVSDYARTNRWEAFAEAFRLWIGWRAPGEPPEPDAQTCALFESLP